MFNAVFFLRLLGIVPAVGRADQIHFVIDGLFIPPSASRPAVRHIFSRVAVRGTVSWVYYSKTYALPLNFVHEVLRFGLSQGGRFYSESLSRFHLCLPPINESFPLNTALFTVAF